MLRNVPCFAALLVLVLPNALSAQQFGGAPRVEVSSVCPYTLVGKLLGIEVSAPARIGDRQFYPHLLHYVKQNPCEALR